MAKKTTAPKQTTATITNCQFKQEMNFDASTVDAVKVVAEGLRLNAEALLNLTKIFNIQGITSPMVQIGSSSLVN
jgi:hypothetical protein